VVDEDKRIIYLKDFDLTLRFKGGLKWHGEQGRLGVIYN
jgi:putative transposase